MLGKHGFIPQYQDVQDKHAFRIYTRYFLVALTVTAAVDQPLPLSKYNRIPIVILILTVFSLGLCWHFINVIILNNSDFKNSL